MIECDFCETKFDLDNVDDESVFGRYESRGECHGFPCSEYTVTGCRCPECGERIDF